MKVLKDYKGVALIYLVLTIFNVIWLVSYEKPNDNSQVKNNSVIVMSEKNN